MATKRDFIARDRTDEQIAEELGCDAVVYQTVAQMEDAVRAAGNGKLAVLQGVLRPASTRRGDITDKMITDIETDRVAAGSRELTA